MAATSFAASTLFSMKNQVALVTGGGTGIGRMIAYAFASNGAKVYITGRRQEVLRQTCDEFNADKSEGRGELCPLQMDTTDKESVLKCAKEIESKEKFLSVLCNNAGIAKGVNATLQEKKGDVEAYSKQMMDYDMDVWSQVYKTNVQAAWFVSAAFLPLLSRARAAQSPSDGASIINITSISGLTRETQHGQEIYNTSKAAFISLTNLMATELVDDKLGIRVNSIAPGYFPSEMTAKLPSAEDYEAYRKRGVPMGRPGKPSEMAQAALLLATNHYIHGQHLTIDGGWLLEHR